MKRISIVLLFILTLFLVNNNSAFSNNLVSPTPNDYENLVVVSNQPKAERDNNYIKYLSASVKVQNGYSCGSGTICYYDETENWAYVISCGHLWTGNKSYDPNSMNKAKIIVWYNSTKLENSKNYTAEVLFWCNDRGFDSSLLRFKPDWRPNCFPIAKEFNYKKGIELNSLGCDGGTEVARYGVEILKYSSPDVITQKNSPRPGRSGGGLLSENGKLVGICWGTSEIDGSGIGYFTPLESIKVVFEKNNHKWILEKPITILIVDRDNPNKKYSSDYIPLPSLNF